VVQRISCETNVREYKGKFKQIAALQTFLNGNDLKGKRYKPKKAEHIEVARKRKKI